MTPTDIPAWRTSSYSGSQENCVEVAAWRTSSHSGTQEACVEVAAWRTSSYTGSGENCVEVAPMAAVVGVRDSKRPGAGTLTLSPGAWRAFVRGVGRG